MEAWRHFQKIEEDGDHLKGVLSAKENQINAKNIENQLEELLTQLDTYSFSYSDEMRHYKERLFCWLHKLLEFAKVSFCFLLDV